MYVITYLAGFISAIIFLFATSEWRRKKRRRKRKFMEEQSGKKVKIDTFSKAVTFMVLVHGSGMVTMSYVLAWCNKEPVSDVSITLVTEIVAPLCLYLVTNCIMNIFEKNELSFSKPVQMQKNYKILDKVHEDMEDETGDNAAG